MNFRISTLLWLCGVLALVFLVISLQHKLAEQQRRIEKLATSEKIASQSAGYFETQSENSYLVRSFNHTYSLNDDEIKNRIRVPDISRVKFCVYFGPLSGDELPKPVRADTFDGAGPGDLIVTSCLSNLGGTTFQYRCEYEDSSHKTRESTGSRMQVNWARGIQEKQFLWTHIRGEQQTAEYPLDKPLILAREYFTILNDFSTDLTTGKTKGYVIWLEYE